MWPASFEDDRVGVAAAVVALIQLGAVVDEKLHDVVAALERRAHQRRAAVVVRRVGVEAQVQQHLHRFEVVLRRALVGDAFDPADAGGGRQRRVAVRRRDLRVGALVEQQLHQLAVARLRGADERRAAVLENHCIVKIVRVSVLSSDPSVRIGAVVRAAT